MANFFIFGGSCNISGLCTYISDLMKATWGQGHKLYAIKIESWMGEKYDVRLEFLGIFSFPSRGTKGNNHQKPSPSIRGVHKKIEPLPFTNFYPHPMPY